MSVLKMHSLLVGEVCPSPSTLMEMNYITVLILLGGACLSKQEGGCCYRGGAVRKANDGTVGAHRLSMISFYKQNYNNLLFYMRELEIIGLFILKMLLSIDLGR